MFSFRGNVLPENRSFVDNYLDKVWLSAIKTSESLLPVGQVPSHVKTKFRAYVAMEEHRMTQNLASVHYTVDALETVQMITGSGTIENVSHMYPILYS